jgi:hypothetical protein
MNFTIISLYFPPPPARKSAVGKPTPRPAVFRRARVAAINFTPRKMLAATPFFSRKSALEIIQDFVGKRFEHCSGIRTNSQKTENRPKKEKEKFQVEGGAEFPPETPLPPRPHFYWRFWEFRGQMQRVRVAKKRGCGRVESKEMKYNFLY